LLEKHKKLKRNEVKKTICNNVKLEEKMKATKKKDKKVKTSI